MAPRTSKYQQIQPAAFRIRLGNQWCETFQILTFPDQWKRLLLATLPRIDTEDPRALPIRSLNKALAALVPDLVTVATKATVGENTPWLYSRTDVDPAAVFAIVTAWARTLNPDPTVAEGALRAMHAAELDWRPTEIDFAALAANAGNGDALGDTQLFHVLPHVLTERITAPGVSHEHTMRDDPEQLVQARSQFLRCPTNRGAKAISWSPHGNPNRPFSFFVTFTVQSRPFTTEPAIHVTTGVHRWCHKPDPFLSGEHGHSVYMLPSVPWIRGVAASRSFLTATIRGHKVSTVDGKAVYGASWDRGLDSILRDLGCIDRMPRPGEIRTDPAATLDRKIDAAALIFSEGMYRFKHPAAPGTSLADRIPLLAWAADQLADHVDLAAPLDRSTRTILHQSTPAQRAATTPTADDTHRLRRAIADATGPMLGIDIDYDTRATLEQALHSLGRALGIDIPDSTPIDTLSQTIATDELTVQLSIRQIGELAADLVPDRTVKDRQEQLRQSVEQRAATITETIDNAAHPTVALVEIPGKREYERARRALDPKFAIKIGLARVGRLTQCLTAVKQASPADRSADQPPSEHGSEILDNCWADLWRQLGVRATPVDTVTKTPSIERAPAYLALWIIRQSRQRTWGATRQIPVAVLISPDGSTIQACAPDVEWAPLHLAQLRIGNKHMISDQRRDAADITRFCEQVIREAGSIHPDTMLLTDAHNLRSGWTYLLNSNLAPDVIGFGSVRRHITQYHGLRHLRVRRTTDHEVADCYAFNQSEESAAYQGLWLSDDDRIFLSTGDKPHTAGKANRYASKITTYTGKKLGETIIRNPRPNAHVWNMRPLEITAAALQNGDDPQDWAALVHELRWASPNYRYATALPWPLRVAEKIGEYVLPIELLDEISDVPAVPGEIEV